MALQKPLWFSFARFTPQGSAELIPFLFSQNKKTNGFAKAVMVFLCRFTPQGTKYKKLKETLLGLGWSGRKQDDRYVIFAERIKTIYLFFATALHLKRVKPNWESHFCHYSISNFVLIGTKQSD